MTIASDSDDPQVYLLRLLVAECATFQSVVGAADKAAALARVHGVEATDESGEVPDDWPRAIVELAPGFEDELVSPGNWISRGQLYLTFEFKIPQSDDATTKQQKNWFMLKLNAIRREMKALAGTGESTTGYTHLNITRITNQDGPHRDPPEEQDQPDPGQGTPKTRWWATLNVEWQG